MSRSRHRVRPCSCASPRPPSRPRAPYRVPFSLLLPDTDLDGALAVAEKLRAAIARLEVPGIDTQITGSFGVASLPLHATDAPTLLRKSDRALYVAKQQGRDRVQPATVHGAEGTLLAEAAGAPSSAPAAGGRTGR